MGLRRFWARSVEQGEMIRKARKLLEYLGHDTTGQPAGEIQGVLMRLGLSHLESLANWQAANRIGR